MQPSTKPSLSAQSAEPFPSYRLEDNFGTRHVARANCQGKNPEGAKSHPNRAAGMELFICEDRVEVESTVLQIKGFQRRDLGSRPYFSLTSAETFSPLVLVPQYCRYMTTVAM